MRELAEYRRTRFDWRAQEARLNASDRFKVPLAGIDVHYLHVQGRGAAPMPLQLSHGCRSNRWPARSARRYGRTTRATTTRGPFPTDPRSTCRWATANFRRRSSARRARSLAERTFIDIRRWRVVPRRGRFAAMEQPDALAEEIRAFYRPLRSGPGG